MDTAAYYEVPEEIAFQNTSAENNAGLLRLAMAKRNNIVQTYF